MMMPYSGPSMEIGAAVQTYNNCAKNGRECLQLIFFCFLLLDLTPVCSQIPSKGRCGDVMKLTTCFPYLLPPSTSQPPPICCRFYSSTFLVPNSTHPCLCNLFHMPRLLGKMINASSLLLLSSQCFGGKSHFVDPVFSCEGPSLLAMKSLFRNNTLLDWSFQTDYCSWRGVLCENSSVVSLNLSNMDLGGEISPLVGNLGRLDTLDLKGNQLRGHIPDDIGNCSNIRTLDLSGNCLDGDIPDVLKKLPKLSVLNFSYNDLSGLIPPGFQPESFLGNPRLHVVPRVVPVSRHRGFLSWRVFWTVMGVVLAFVVLILGYLFYRSCRLKGEVIRLGEKLPLKCY